MIAIGYRNRLFIQGLAVIWPQRNTLRGDGSLVDDWRNTADAPLIERTEDVLGELNTPFIDMHPQKFAHRCAVETRARPRIITRCATLFIPDNLPQAGQCLLSLPN